MITIEYDEITPEIILGSYPQDETTFSYIAETLKADAVLCLQHEDDFRYLGLPRSTVHRMAIMAGLTWRHYPITDFNERDLLKRLPEAVSELRELIEEGKRVYVHCTMGINRSATTVTAYLMAYQDMDFKQAIEHVRARRKGAILYDKVLKKYQKKIKKMR